MKVIITRQFDKDVDKELSKAMKLKLADIEKLQKTTTLYSINDMKKLKGYKTLIELRWGIIVLVLFLKKTPLNSAGY
jgi:hypothetical protein